MSNVQDITPEAVPEDCATQVDLNSCETESLQIKSKIEFSPIEATSVVVDR